jgi:hypothetical protein
MRATNGIRNLQGMSRDEAVAAGVHTHTHPLPVLYTELDPRPEPSAQDLDRVVAEQLIETYEL